MHRRAVIIAVAILLAGLAGVAVGQELRVEYQGELVDEGARPLGGVFPLTFKLYPSADATEPIWTEQHYVAVVDGEYTIQLGDETPLDPSLAGGELYVAVEFLDQEILRAPLTMRPVPTEEEEMQQVLGVGTEHEITFAQLADRALLAEEAVHARDCDTLAGHTAAELDRSSEVLDRLSQHETDPGAHGGGRSSGIGSSTTVLQHVGGEGGNRYTRMCPTGYVVVGARGGAGGMVDSFELVCAPLE